MRNLQSFQQRHQRARMRVISSLTLLLYVFLVANAVPVHAQVQYELTWLENIWGPGWSVQAAELNNQGTIVGSATQIGQNPRAFVRTAQGPMIELNSIGGRWYYQNVEVTQQGWKAEGARVNNLGQIAGTAKVQNVSRAFLLKNPSATPPIFELLPDVSGFVGGTGVIRINNSGVILGYVSNGTTNEYVVYSPFSLSPYASAVRLGVGGDTRADINENGVIVSGSGYSMQPNAAGSYPGVVESVANRQLFRINNLNLICGRRSKQGAFPGGPILRSSEEEFLLAPSKSSGDFAMGINDSGDVAFTIAGRGFLKNASGTLALDKLLNNADADWTGRTISLWDLSERSSTGFGRILGKATISLNTRSFVLTPFSVP